MENYKEFLDNGIYEFYEGNFRNAIALFNKSIELNKEFSVTYFYRGASYHSIEEYDEAMMDYTKAITLDPKMTDAYYNRAKVILSRKDIQNPDILKAVADLNKALELDENFADALQTFHYY
jgi:tetratricopeptide (TPR) repeat protein